MRGNLVYPSTFASTSGPIPADAGEPSEGNEEPISHWAYPRGCGGTYSDRPGRRDCQGLSPRMRGNLLAGPVVQSVVGPIPADAGEPIAARAGASKMGAYPRGCGGTISTRSSFFRPRGLSPRMRGNPRLHPSRESPGGPIPADAGEPSHSPSTAETNRAYPRGCGGTPSTYWRRASAMGLSPRMRGNRDTEYWVRGGYGPIPADAGEPTEGKRNFAC